MIVTKPESALIRMDSNENAFGPSPRAVAAIRKAKPGIHRYPLPDGLQLRAALARKFKISPDEVMLGAGSTELIEIIASTYLSRGTNAVTANLTFVMYPFAAQKAGAALLTVPLQDYRYDLPAMLKVVNEQTRIVFIANPNNPTGTMISAEELSRFLDKVPPEILVVLDEAYFEYVTDKNFPDAFALRSRHRNLVLLRTFSKVYGLAGMRIGYAIASAEIISRLNQLRLPYNTSVLAEAAALAALGDTRHVAKSRSRNQRERDFLQREFRRRNIKCIPSMTNFLYLPDPPTGLVKTCQRHHVVLRAFPDGVRVTIGARAENRKLLTCFDL